MPSHRPNGLLAAVLSSVALAPLQAAGAQEARPSAGYIRADDGVRLFHRVDGSGRDTVIALHGGPGFSMAYLRPDLERLATGRAVVYYDQRGGGRSTLVADDSSVNIARHVDDLDAVRRYFGLERLVLLGHSWGAGLGAQYAMRFPERVGALLLVSPTTVRRTPFREQLARNRTAGMDDSTRERLAALGDARSHAPDPVATCRAYYALFFRGFYADPARMSAARGNVCDDSPEAVRNQERTGSLTLRSLGGWDWRAALADIPARSLVIYGVADPIPVESAREWATMLPNARLLMLEDSGHFPFVEQPDEFFAAVDEFLNGRWPAGARKVTDARAQPRR